MTKQNSHLSDTTHWETTEIVEWDIDNPIFITLIGISAEIQVWIDYSPENRSLQFVWETVSAKLNEMNLKHPISVSLCSPQETERWFAYILIEVAGQQTQIFAKDRKSAEIMTQEMQEFYIEHTAHRIKLLLWDAPATQEKLQTILHDEKTVLEKHRMTAIIQQDTTKSWTISFEAEV